MLERELVNAFMESPEAYVEKANDILEIYFSRWGNYDIHEFILKWKDETFKEKVQSNFRTLSMHYESIVRTIAENYYLDTSWQIVPFVGFEATIGWAEKREGRIDVLLPLENVENERTLRIFLNFSYAYAYLMEKVDALSVRDERDFFCIARNVPLFGISHYISMQTCDADEVSAIWGNRRYIFRLWYQNIVRNIHYYSRRLDMDMEQCVDVVFWEWFRKQNLSGRKGSAISLRFAIFLFNQGYTIEDLSDKNRDFFRYKFKQFYEDSEQTA